jgi:hypothetical protein
MSGKALAGLRAPATLALAQLQRELSSEGTARLRVQLERIKASTKVLDSVTSSRNGVDDANNR